MQVTFGKKVAVGVEIYASSNKKSNESDALARELVALLPLISDAARLTDEGIKLVAGAPSVRDAVAVVFRQRLSGATLAQAFNRLDALCAPTSQPIDTPLHQAPKDDVVLYNPSPQSPPQCMGEGKANAVSQGWGQNQPLPIAETPSPSPIITTRVDPELARIAVGLRQAAGLRLWLIARHISNEENGGCGWITASRLRDHIKESYSSRHLRRILKDGDGLFWTQAHGRLYLRGVGKVAAALTKHAAVHQPGLIVTNRPGGLRDMHLPLDGSHAAWEATIYAGWLAAREDPSIARDTLATLFGRSKQTLRRWERDHLADTVTVIPAYAQTADPEDTPANVPAFAYVAAVRDPDAPHAPAQYQVRVRWQLPNQYRTHDLKSYARRGQSRKVRAAVLTALNSHPMTGQQPLNFTAEGSPRCPRRYFESTKQVMRQRKRRRQAESTTPTYVYRGYNHDGHLIYEYTHSGFTDTVANERVGKIAEGRYLGRQRRRMSRSVAVSGDVGITATRPGIKAISHPDDYRKENTP